MLEALGLEIASLILVKLDAVDVASIAQTSRFWRDACRDARLWTALTLRHFPHLAAHAAVGGRVPTTGGASGSSGGGRGGSDGVGLATGVAGGGARAGAGAAAGAPTTPGPLLVYQRAHAEAQLKSVRWQRVRQNRHRPPPREGHAACPWGDSGMLLFGGFRHGNLNDIHYLANVGGSGGGTGANGNNSGDELAAQPGESSSGNGSSGSSCRGTDDPGAVEWVRLPPATGRPPTPRYGHTITRCVGADGEEVALVFGGLTMGGYVGEVVDVVALRRAPRTPGELKQAAEAGRVPPDSATAAAVAAAAAGHGSSRSGRGGDNDNAAQVAGPQLEWFRPEIRGEEPPPRGYHGAAASPDGTKVYFFGGITDGASTASLAVLDVAAWRWHHPATTGSLPPPRFGCSLAVWGGGLWVVGGGWGSDLLRSGGDHRDVWRLDLETMEWRDMTAALGRPCPRPEPLGRCHGSALVGSKLVMFAGGLGLSEDVLWLDLATLRFGGPTVKGNVPQGRLSPTVVPGRAAAHELLVFGGFSRQAYPGELGDLYRLRLLPDDLLPGGPPPALPAGAAWDEPLRTRRGGVAAMPGGLLHAFMAQMLGAGNVPHPMMFFGDDDDEEDEEDEDDEEFGVDDGDDDYVPSEGEE